jgi:hypothetical protein
MNTNMNATNFGSIRVCDSDLLSISVISDTSSITDITIDESFEGDSMNGDTVFESVESVYDPYTLSRQQIEAGLEIIEIFINNPNNIRWAILLAQMQSGKTETYLFVCCELIRRNIVKSVVIFSGNAETDLKEQLLKEVNGTGDSKFYGKYENYLEDKENITRNQRRNILAQVKIHIQVLWGTELKKCSDNYTETLFVWEESHFAQNLQQCPDKFLTNAGISANGDCETLKEKRNFVISNSATPFSEMSCLHHLTQNKQVVHMKPGIGYNSVKAIRDSGRLKSFKTIEEGLVKALNNRYEGTKYGIVRITSKNEENIKNIITRNGWSYVVFDSISKGEVRELGLQTWNGMNNAPTENTVILLRGKCRMGKNLEKKHVAFVMETAKNTNTDTLLQGLLGRVCGYSEGSNNVDVYILEKIVNREELNKYIDLIEGKENMPSRARNLVQERKDGTRPSIPIKITRDFERFPRNNKKTKKNKDNILKDIHYALNNNIRIQNSNNQTDFNEVRRKFNIAYDSNKKNLKIGYLNKKTSTRGQNLADNIKKAFTENLAVTFGSSCGIDAEGLEINIWVPSDNIERFEANEIYITAGLDKNSTSPDYIPLTTRREVFAHSLEDGTEIVGNGDFTIPLNHQSSTDISVMLSELKEFIAISNGREGTSRRITSSWDEANKVFKGIVVTLQVLRALETGGSIHKEILDIYGLTLSIAKAKGPVPKNLKEKGFVRLVSISW